jgi:hypothetical protein
VERWPKLTLQSNPVPCPLLVAHLERLNFRIPHTVTVPPHTGTESCCLVWSSGIRSSEDSAGLVAVGQRS